MAEIYPYGFSAPHMSFSYFCAANQFLNGELVTDEFYKGIPWNIGLKRFMSQPGAKDMLFYFRPLYKNAAYLVDLDQTKIPGLDGQKSVLRINDVQLIPEYKSIINFNSQN